MIILIFLFCLFLYFYFVIGRLVYAFLIKNVRQCDKDDPEYALCGVFWPIWLFFYIPYKTVISIIKLEGIVTSSIKSFLERGKM